MAYMAWKNEYSVNVSEIDKQHTKMFALINELENAICNGQGKPILEKVFRSMTEYAFVHFKTEEAYFEKFNYPQAEEHKEEHLAFKNKLEEFKDFLDQNSEYSIITGYLSVEVVKFLHTWWVSHICQEDKKYMKFFNDNGLV